MMKWLNSEDETEIDGFDFKKLKIDNKKALRKQNKLLKFKKVCYAY